jgi:hypothetical protein
MELHQMSFNHEREIEVDYKGYKIFREPTYNLWSIKPIDGSTIPNAVAQRFTEIRIAKETLDNYLEKRKISENNQDNTLSKQ